MDSADRNLLASIIDALLRGRRIFLTGGAGTGKTHVVRQIAKILARSEIRTAITASTGLASTLLFEQLDAADSTYLRGPSTLHSAARLPLSDQEDNPGLVESGRDSLADIKVVIIDEISMVDRTTFDRFLQRVRTNVGILAVGDFYQLPPVREDANHEPEFAFRSHAFESFEVCELTRNYRQDDPAFIAFLRRLRHGSLGREYLTDIPDTFDLRFPVLFGTRRETERHNTDQIYRIPEEPQISEAQVAIGNPRTAFKWFANHTRGERRLEIKVGMRVMNIQNQSLSGKIILANGDLGTITAIGPPRSQMMPSWLTVKFDRCFELRVIPYEFICRDADGNIKYSILQFPLIPAYGLTVHKAQGLTLDVVNVDGARINFTAGHVYVALSRCRTKAGLRIRNSNYFSAFSRPQVESYYQSAPRFVINAATSPDQCSIQESVAPATQPQASCPPPECPLNPKRGLLRIIWDSIWN